MNPNIYKTASIMVPKEKYSKLRKREVLTITDILMRQCDMTKKELGEYENYSWTLFILKEDTEYNHGSNCLIIENPKIKIVKEKVVGIQNAFTYKLIYKWKAEQVQWE